MRNQRTYAVLAGIVVSAAGATASGQYTVGDQWLRAADFVDGPSHGSTAGNPGPGFDGAPVWQYELATSGGGVGSANPWFKQSSTVMSWDSDWWGIGEGAWSASDNVNPPVFRDRMTHNIIGSHYDRVPMVRWVNPGGDDMQVSIDGQYNVLWSGNLLVGDAVDVELVVARERAATGDVDVLFSTLVSKPTPGLSIGDSVDVPVDLSMVHLDDGDSLIFSGRATDSKSGLGRWVVISDHLGIQVVPVPAPGTLALLGVAGLSAAGRRRR
jgi:hypothetical protein